MAEAKWGRERAESMREQIEKTADAVETVESYPLNVDDSPAGPLRRED